MAALNITEADVLAEADRRGITNPSRPEMQAIKRDLAQQELDGKRRRKPAPEPLVVVTQVRRGDEILSTTEQTIPNT